MLKPTAPSPLFTERGDPSLKKTKNLLVNPVFQQDGDLPQGASSDLLAPLRPHEPTGLGAAVLVFLALQMTTNPQHIVSEEVLSPFRTNGDGFALIHLHPSSQFIFSVGLGSKS